jgi:antitoxin (DNA-binding transcriptional repressor) of toxin-antitoxin stability system
MTTINIEDARDCLSELVDAAARGETVLISKDRQLSVRLVPVVTQPRRRQFGSAKGLIHSPDDFDAPLADFREYEQ